MIQIVMYPICKLCFRMKVRGAKYLDTDGGGLLLANHQSFLDPILLGIGLGRSVSFLAREDLFRVFLLGWICKKCHTLPIDPEAGSVASLRLSVNRIKAGGIVGVFPEGSRTLDGKMDVFKPGFIALLRRTHCPVFPVGIAGAFEVMPRGRILPRFGTIRVVYGEPISDAELQPFLVKGQEQQLVDLIEQRITDCQRQAEEWRNGSKDPDNKNQVVSAS